MGINKNQKKKKKIYTRKKKKNNIAIRIGVPLRDLGIEVRERENWKKERKNFNFVERERKI